MSRIGRWFDRTAEKVAGYTVLTIIVVAILSIVITVLSMVDCSQTTGRI